VSVEDLGDEEVHENAPAFPAEVYDAIVPPFTPSGRPIRRTYPWKDDEDVITAVARGLIVHPGSAGIALLTRPDLVHVPIRDLPPMPVGLIWRTVHQNARICALAAAARSIYRPSTRTATPPDAGNLRHNAETRSATTGRSAPSNTYLGTCWPRSIQRSVRPRCELQD
jgi:hypothetical protein